MAEVSAGFGIAAFFVFLLWLLVIPINLEMVECPPGYVIENMTSRWGVYHWDCVREVGVHPYGR